MYVIVMCNMLGLLLTNDANVSRPSPGLGLLRLAVVCWPMGHWHPGLLGGVSH